MPEDIFIFTKEMAELLKMMRQRARLSQQEVAVRLGLSRKSGKIYVSSLERGEIKNPTIGTILRFLKVCGVSWSSFFAELSAIDFGMGQEKSLAQAKLPEDTVKTAYHVLRSDTSIKYFPYHKYKYVDIIRVKSTIDNKIFELLNESKIEKDLIPYYMLFADEFFSVLEEKLLRAALKPSVMLKIKRTVQKVLSEERKKISGKKPVASDKQLQMAIGFSEHQVAIEPILNEVRKILNKIAPRVNWIMLYEDFAQELCAVLIKYYNKNQELLDLAINEIVERWVKRGLKQSDLLEVKEATISAFKAKWQK
jgi:transcriptional regulator with XRE-family HTH domain